MCSEIGVLAASRIPKGVLFGSLPTRLIKSESNDGQKFGFVEVQYTNGELVSQYGSQFNWMKYISVASSDTHEKNIEAFIDESGEISFETSRDIERGQEMLYAFGKQHCDDDKPDAIQHGQWSNRMSQHENLLQDWSAEKHTSYDNEAKRDEQTNDPVEKSETALLRLDDEKQRTNRNLWFAGSFEKNSPRITHNEQTRMDDRLLPWFSERLRMSRYHDGNEIASHENTDKELRNSTNGMKACRLDNVNWYQVPVAVTRPLGCTCTWSQPYLPRKTYEYKAIYDSYVERRPRSDDDPHSVEQSCSSHNTMSLQQRREPEEPPRTLTREKMNSEEDFKDFSKTADEKEDDKMMVPGDLLEKKTITKSKTSEKGTTDENKGNATVEASKNISKSDGSKSLEHDNNKHVQSKCSDHKQNLNTNEKNTKQSSVEEFAPNTKSDEKPSSEQARNGSRFVCDYCGKSYCRRYVLKIHMRTHTGHKPLHCTVCWKSFGDPSNLKKHIRSHARKNAIYTCEHCGRGSFYRLCDLVRHIKFRHRLANAEKWPNNNGGLSSNKKQDEA